MKLTRIEYFAANVRPQKVEKEFVGRTPYDAIESWVMWNENEAFDFRTPSEATSQFLQAHLHKDGDMVWLGAENVNEEYGGEKAMAIVFKLTE